MTEWLRPLLDPSPLARQGRMDTHLVSGQSLLALLVLGDFNSFAMAAATWRLELPHWLPGARFATRNVDADYTPGFPETSLILGTLNFVGGRGDGHKLLTELLNTGDNSRSEDALSVTMTELDDDLIACASAIAALSLIDAGQQQEAITLLDRVYSHIDEPYSSAFVALHIAAALAEGGDSGWRNRQERLWRAVLERELPGDNSVPVGGTALDDLLMAAAQRGLAQRQNAAGFSFFEPASSFWAKRILQREENGPLVDLAVGLLDTAFRRATGQATDSAASRSLGNDSAADISLALLRARLLADVVETSVVRRLLARHQIIGAFGSFDADPAASALSWLYDSGDRSGVRHACQTLWRAGPHVGLKRTTQAALAPVVSRSREVSMDADLLTLLREAADLLSTDEADFLVSLCLEAIDRGYKWSLSVSDLLQLSGNLCGAASDTSHERLADLVIRGDRQRADDSFYQRLANKVRWRHISAEKQLEAFDWAVMQLNSATDSHGGALAVIERVAFVDPPRAIDTVRSAVSVVSNYSVLIALWNIGQTTGLFNESDMDKLVSASVNFVATIRADAQEGRFSFYAGASPTVVLARAAVFGGRNEAWDPLLDFLLDPRVADQDKEDGLRFLIGQRENVPSSVAGRLRTEYSRVAGYTLLVSSSSEASLFSEAGGVMRTGIRTPEQLASGIAFGAIPSDVALSVVAELAGSSVASDRRHAASMIELLGDRGLLPSVVPLALALARDDVVDVRAVTLQTLAMLSPVEDWLQPAVRRVIRTGLHDPGVLVPLHILRGIRRARVIEPELLESVEGMANHASALVREAVRAVVEDSSRVGPDA